MVLSQGSSSHPRRGRISYWVYCYNDGFCSQSNVTNLHLPCMMVISTLSAPANAVQCQESSGQILSCSYATQNLSNDQQIVVITVYVPSNFVFSSPAVAIRTISREQEGHLIHTQIIA